MTRINKFSTIQSTNVQGAEHAQPAATNQPPAEDLKNASSATASSANTWQRASLLQDGIAQQTNLQNKLVQGYDYSKQDAATQAKAASEEKQTGALLGTIFGGPIIGTHIGNAIQTEASHTEPSPLRDLLNKMQDEVKKMESQLKQIQDDSFIETVGSFFGYDRAKSEAAQASNNNPIKDLPKEASTKVVYDPDDD